MQINIENGNESTGTIYKQVRLNCIRLYNMKTRFKDKYKHVCTCTNLVNKLPFPIIYSFG